MTDTTFGQTISKARKTKGWSQKDLAAHIRREEDGESISPQYLNDIEHDRRNPSSDHMVQQFATVLEIDADWLYFLAGRFPEDIRGKRLTEKEVTQAMRVFRGGGKTKGKS
jgi:transcriptional regulator with XRE-family HTH domain